MQSSGVAMHAAFRDACGGGGVQGRSRERHAALFATAHADVVVMMDRVLPLCRLLWLDPRFNNLATDVKGCTPAPSGLHRVCGSAECTCEVTVCIGALINKQKANMSGSRSDESAMPLGLSHLPVQELLPPDGIQECRFALLLQAFRKHSTQHL